MSEQDVQATGSLTVEDAQKMYENYKSYWAENYKEAVIDLKMAAGDPATHYGQGWDDAYSTPVGPMVVDNELPQYIHQVTNDIRQNVPSIKVLPVSDADIETAEIYRGLFRAIEDHSHADEVCDTAAEYAVACSIGFMAVDHAYCDGEPGVQEIIFKTIPDPLSEYLDPASVEYDGRDSNGHISLSPINRKDFERLYKGKKFVSFTDPKADASKTDSIVLAQIFIRETDNENNTVVRRYLFSGEDLLKETIFPGKYIPRVPIYGEVKWIEGKRVLSSLIRGARSPQRRLNHMLSKESQLLAQAPIAPIMAVEGTLVNERKQWQVPGLENALEYRQQDLDGNPAPQPTRLQPPGASTGFLEAIASAKEAIKASMGIYNAGLGKREGDASGIALQQLDRSGDIATFHYPDNVRRSYGHMGEIVIDMVPVIYDTPRIIQTLNDESDVVMVGINGMPLQPDQKQAYDLTKGKYRVRVTTGASYTTKRQEEAAFLTQIAQKDPNFMQIGGDILFKSMDTPGAQALAARYKKIINPQLLDDKDQPQIPPQLIQKMQQMEQIIQQGAQEIQQLQAQLQSKQAEDQAKLADTQLKGADLQLKGQDLQLKMQVEQSKAENERAKLQLEAEKLEIERMKLGMQAEQQINQQPIAPVEQEDDPQIEMAELELQQQRNELERQEIEQRAAQANAVIGALAAISQQLAELAKPKPISIVRANPDDPFSPIIGAA